MRYYKVRKQSYYHICDDPRPMQYIYVTEDEVKNFNGIYIMIKKKYLDSLENPNINYSGLEKINEEEYNKHSKDPNNIINSL